MLAYIARRLLNYVALALIATAGGYLIASAALNPISRFLGRNPPIPPETITANLNRLGANPDIPVLIRMKDWFVNLFTQGSLGISTRGTEVLDDIVSRAGTSLRLLILGTLIGAIIGVSLGVLGAVRQYSWVDRGTSFFSYLILATPTFVIAVVLMILATRFNGLVGRQIITFTGEYTPGLTGGFWTILYDRAVHLLLPTITLALGAIASYSRYQRSSMLDVLSADYIRTARAKGRTRGSAIVRHGVRVALIPMSTFFAYSFGLILTGASVTELTFSWHGMGEYLVESIRNNDINASAGTILFTAILVLIAGTLADVLYAALDPRVRV